MKYPDDLLRTIAQIQSQIVPYETALGSSTSRDISQKLQAAAATQKALDQAKSFRSHFGDRAAEIAQRALGGVTAQSAHGFQNQTLKAIAQTLYASDIASISQAIGIEQRSDIASAASLGLLGQSTYINEIDKLRRNMGAILPGPDLIQLNDSLRNSTAADHINSITTGSSLTAAAAVKAMEEQALNRAKSLSLEAQLPHIAMDAFQRATAWLSPIDDIRSIATREAERYRALNAASEPWDLLRDVVQATARNPFSELASDSAYRIIESLRNLPDLFGEEDFEEEPEDIEVSDSELEPYASIAQTELGNQVVLDRASIEALVTAFIAAYESRPSARSRQIFQIYIFPVLVNLIFSWINPYHDFIVKQNLEAAKPATEKSVQQAARSSGAPTYVLDSFRFVTASTLSVRVNGRVRSPVLGTLRFGQPVEMLKKDGDWTLVRYSDSENEIEIQGWVLSRYLKKFK